MTQTLYSLDQLMELAGLAVSQAVYNLYPPSSLSPSIPPTSQTFNRILFLCGPGNNGGDGLVASRHVKHLGYNDVRVLYPKQGRNDIYPRLVSQARDAGVTFLSTPLGNDKLEREIHAADVVVDCIFGFSFSSSPGNPIREPFADVISCLAKVSNGDVGDGRGKKPVLAVDAPSGWDIENGPSKNNDDGKNPGVGYMPSALISLTAPKPLSRFFTGKGKRHFIGGRFLSQKVADEFGIDVPDYKGTDQIVEVDVEDD